MKLPFSRVQVQPASARTYRAATWTSLGTRRFGRAGATCAAIAFFVALYLLPGIVGHDPWKQDETYTFGIVQHMLDTGRLLVPVNAGQPFMEKPPLYYWVAAALAWLCKPWLPLHDGARLASFVFGALTLLVVALLARRIARAPSLLHPRVLGTVALFAGSFIVQKHLHDMFSDVALGAGAALGIFGLHGIAARLVRAAQLGAPLPVKLGELLPQTAPARRPVARDALLLGIGVGIAFLSKGVFIPVVFGATVVLLPVLVPACRQRAYVGAIGTALLACAPFALIWPAWLAARAPHLFVSWFWDNNVGRFLGFSVPELGSANDSWVVLRALAGGAFPTGPLAVLGLCLVGWRRLRTPDVAVPALFCAIGFLVLSMSATARVLYVLPFMLPLALLAAEAVARLPARASVIWDYASRVLFSTAGALVWAVWVVMLAPAESHAPAQWLARWLPIDYVLPLRPVEAMAAVLLSVCWCLTVPLLERLGRWRGPASWLIGATLAWGLAFTLLLPWMNQAKSYTPVFTALSARLAPHWKHSDCMSSINLGESEAPMLYYVSHILHRPQGTPGADTCRWLIVQHTRTQQVPLAVAAQPDPPAPPALRPAAQSTAQATWQPFWSGARDGDDNEMLSVYRRTDMPGE